jgi:hypothetical protein
MHRHSNKSIPETLTPLADTTAAAAVGPSPLSPSRQNDDLLLERKNHII